jgi:hypothetical protein
MARVVSAQGTSLGPELRPSVVANVGMVPTTDLALPGQSYGFGDARLRVAVPIVGAWDLDSGDIANFRLLALDEFKTDSAVLPYVNCDRNCMRWTWA